MEAPPAHPAGDWGEERGGGGESIKSIIRGHVMARMQHAVPWFEALSLPCLLNADIPLAKMPHFVTLTGAHRGSSSSSGGGWWWWVFGGGGGVYRLIKLIIRWRAMASMHVDPTVFMLTGDHGGSSSSSGGGSSSSSGGGSSSSSGGGSSSSSSGGGSASASGGGSASSWSGNGANGVSYTATGGRGGDGGSVFTSSDGNRVVYNGQPGQNGASFSTDEDIGPPFYLS